MQKIDARLTENPPHNGIIQFELVGNAQDALEMIDAWGPELSLLTGKSIKVDFIFIPAYVLLFFTITMLFSLLVTGVLRTLIGWIAFLPIVSGIADVIENIFLLSVLRSGTDIPIHYPTIASVCASIKFGLLIVVIVFWIVAVVARIAGRKGTDR